MNLLPPLLLLVSSTAFVSRPTTPMERRLMEDPLRLGDFPFNIGEMPIVDENVRKKKIAKEALQKLLVRQQRQVQETLDLIETLDLNTISNSYEQDAHAHENESHSNTTTLSTAPFIAASVASGTDYGYLSRSDGSPPTNQRDFVDVRFQGYGPPGNVFQLGSTQFLRNLNAMMGEVRGGEPRLTKRQRELQKKLEGLTLDSTKIWERERRRGPLVAPLIIKIPYLALCQLLDVVFQNTSPFSRFFLLETVARMPYFSYITMLHLYETLGFWRRSADIKRIHFAEEWNEFHHLLIMESLGGDQPYWVRFTAQHSALMYYIALCFLWMISPTLSYKFSEMLETHAVDTYGQFVDENEDKLKNLPPSIAAVEYYTVGVADPMFGEYQTASVANPDRGIRRSGADLRSLYDVFVAIRNDEGDHVSTMKSCLDPTEVTLSPALESRVLTGVALAASVGYFFDDSTLLDRFTTNLDPMTANIQGLESLSDMGASTSDLDTILSASGGGIKTNFINGVVSGLAELANGVREVTGVDPDLDEDVADTAGSIIEDAAAGGLDGIEVDGLFVIIKNVVIGFLEVLGMGL